MSEKDESRSDNVDSAIEAIIGMSALIGLAVAFVSIFWYPMTSIAASVYAFTAIASITILKK